MWATDNTIRIALGACPCSAQGADDGSNHVQEYERSAHERDPDFGSATPWREPSQDEAEGHAE